MKEKGLTSETRHFFRNFKREEVIDDSQFEEWKEELQKDINHFWRSFKN